MARGNSAAQRRSGGGAGGGIRSNKNVSVPVRKGASATGVRPAAVSQFGSAIGNKATDAGKIGYRGEKYQTATPISVPLGNEVATRVGKGGPGADRVVMKSGTQGVQGPTNPGIPNPGAKKPIFPGFR
jgi:hypothetical protein